MNLPKAKFIFTNNMWTSSPLLKEEALYKEQFAALTSALLLNDFNCPMPTLIATATMAYKTFYPKGSLVSGSFIANEIGTQLGRPLPVKDVDIYFKSKEDAQFFLETNKVFYQKNTFKSDMCAYIQRSGAVYNLIYGVQYETPADLISGFDIRACSVALDPNNSELHFVKGAVSDILGRHIVWNYVPKKMSVSRLVKYVEKGFKIDSYQRLFFIELLRSNIHDSSFELATGAY